MWPPPASESFAMSSQLECIDDARRWAGGQVRAAGIPEDAVFELELALTEALSNVIRHAYRGEGGHTIDLSLAIDDRRLELSLHDRGRPFDDTYRPPDLATPEEGNYGVHLIDQLVDEVHRRPRPGGGTVLSLVKYRKGEDRV